MSKGTGIGLVAFSVGFAAMAIWCGVQAGKGLEASGMNSLYAAMKENVNNVGFFTSMSMLTGILTGTSALSAIEEFGNPF